VTEKQEQEVERPLEQWKYAYVAASVDFGGNIASGIQKAPSNKLNYAILPMLRISNPRQSPILVIDNFCQQHNITVNIRAKSQGYIAQITKRSDIIHFCNLVRPYLLGQVEPVGMLIDDLIPILQDGIESKQEFVEAVKIVDRINEVKSNHSSRKYSADYFREEWDLQ